MSDMVENQRFLTHDVSIGVTAFHLQVIRVLLEALLLLHRFLPLFVPHVRPKASGWLWLLFLLFLHLFEIFNLVRIIRQLGFRISHVLRLDHTPSLVIAISLLQLAILESLQILTIKHILAC